MGNGDEWGWMGINFYTFILQADEWGWMEDECIRCGYYSFSFIPIHPPFIPLSSLTMYNCRSDRYLKQYNLISWHLRGIYMHTLPNKSQQKSQLRMFRLTQKWILRMNGGWIGDEWGWMGKSWSPFIPIPHSSAMSWDWQEIRLSFRVAF